jgi:hypothetical protein
LAAQVLTGKLSHKDVSAEDWDIVAPYVKNVEAASVWHDGAEPQIEHWVDGPGFTPGKVDASLRPPGKLIIWDAKFGRRPVEVVENRQLLLYAIMMAPDLDTEVELRIVQPLAWHPDGIVRSWIVPDLEPYRVSVHEAMRECKTDTPTLRATPNNCLYCKAVTNCPAARNVTLGGWDMAIQQTGQLPAEAVRPELIALRTAKKLIDSRLTALEAEAEARIRNGEAITGCTMHSGRAGKRVWSAEPDRVKEVCAMLGKQAAKEQLLTPAQLIKEGVPENVIDALSERQSPKKTVSTDASEITRKMFEQ